MYRESTKLKVISLTCKKLQILPKCIGVIVEGEIKMFLVVYKGGMGFK